MYIFIAPLLCLSGTKCIGFPHVGGSQEDHLHTQCQRAVDSLYVGVSMSLVVYSYIYLMYCDFYSVSHSAACHIEINVNDCVLVNSQQFLFGTSESGTQSCHLGLLMGNTYCINTHTHICQRHSDFQSFPMQSVCVYFTFYYFYFI